MKRTSTRKELEGGIVPVGINELLADMVAKGDIAIESVPVTLSKFRVRLVAPTTSEHTFEPRCWIEAEDSELGNVRVFDVPDPDEGQQAIARRACNALNAHDAMVALVAWMVEDNQIVGSTCPSCGRDNSEYDRVCTSDDCLGVQARAALKLAEG